MPKLIAQGITKYSTDADPNISETELNSFKQEIYEGFIGTSDSKFSYCAGGYGSDNIVRKDAILSKFDRLYFVNFFLLTSKKKY